MKGKKFTNILNIVCIIFSNIIIINIQFLNSVQLRPHTTTLEKTPYEGGGGRERELY